MKRLFIGLGSVIFIIIAAVVLVPGFMDWNQYKQTIVDLAEKQTGYDIDLQGDLKISLLPSPEAFISNVKIKSPKSRKYESFINLERLDLSLAFAPLLSGQIEVTSLELVKPEIFIEILSDGSQSWQTNAINTFMNNKNTSEAGNNGSLSKISLQSVSISAGKLFYFDEKTKAENKIDKVNVTLKADALTGPFSGRGSLSLLGRDVSFEGQTGRLEGEDKSVALNVKGSVAPEGIEYGFGGVIGYKDQIDLQGETEISIGNIASFMQGAPLKTGPLNTKGILTFKNGSFEYQNANISINNQKLQGNIKGTTNPLAVGLDVTSQSFNLASVLSGENIPDTKSLALKGNGKTQAQIFSFDGFEVSLDNMKVSGDVKYNTSASRPLLIADVKLDNFDAGMFASKNAPSSNTSLEQTIANFNLPFDVDLNLDMQNGSYGAYKLSGLATSLAFENSSLKLEKLNIDSFAGAKISASGSVANIQKLEGINLKASLNSTNFKETAKIMNFDAVSVPEKLNNGTVSVQLKGDKSLLDITASLNAGGGEASLSGKVNNALGASPAISGMELQVKHSNLNEAVNLVSAGFGSYTNLNKPVNFYTRIEQSGAVYTFNEMKADLGGISAQGSGSVDLSNSKPRISGDLQLGDVVVQGGQKTQTSSNTAWSRQAMSSSWMNLLDFDLKVAAKSIDYQGWKMNAPSFEANLANGSLNIKELNGGLYDGQLFLTGNLKPYSQDGGYTLDGSAKLRSVSFEPLLKSFAGDRILRGSGLVDIDTNLSMAGLSSSALISSMKGDGVLAGENIILDGFDLKRFARALSSESKPGDTVLGLYKTSIKGGQTRFDKMDGQYDIREGIIYINTLNMDGPEAFLSTTGQVNLPLFQLSTVHEITLKGEDVPPFKINISGPLNNPTQTLGQGLLNDYISRKVNRKLQDVVSDKLGGKLDQLFGAPSTQQQPVNDNSGSDVNSSGDAGEVPAEQQPPVEKSDPKEEAIKGLLKGLLQ